MIPSLRSFNYFFLTMLIFFISLPTFALSIDNVRVGVHPDKSRMVMELSNTTNFRAFLLADPYRIVVDLPDFTWKAGLMAEAPGSGVTNMRHGPLGGGTSRIVIDLNRPVTIQSAFLLPRSAGAPDRLVIDFSRATDAAHRAGINKFFGTGNNAQQVVLQPRPARPDPDNRQQLEEIPASPEAPPSVVSGKKPIIVIDAGHGGVDPGAIGANGIKEKNVTLGIAQELKRQLENSGQYKVHLTRDDDTFIKLQERVAIARRKGADLFVSLHADSIDKPGVSGTSIYTLSDKASDAQSEKLAARENKADLIAGIDLSSEDKEVANILVDLAMRDTMNQSRFFSAKLSRNFSGAGLKLLDKPQRSAGFAVLKAPDVPSVLIETGFMSNNRESRLLNSPEHRKKISAAIKRGIDDYFEQVRKNQRL